jgi:hypothetical protein
MASSKGRKDGARARKDPGRDDRRRTSRPRPEPPLRRSRMARDLVDLPTASAVAELFADGDDLLVRDAEWDRAPQFDDELPRP